MEFYSLHIDAFDSFSNNVSYWIAKCIKENSKVKG